MSDQTHATASPTVRLVPDSYAAPASPTIGALAAALAKAQATISGAAKDSTNPHFRAKYADLASVWDACRASLTREHLAVVQQVEASGPEVTVTTWLLHDSGEWIRAGLTLTARDASPQAVGSAITYGRRYGLASLVGVAPEDDDAEGAQPHRQAPTRDADVPGDPRATGATGHGSTTGAPSGWTRPSESPVVQQGLGLITEAQQKRLFARAKAAGHDMAMVRAWLLAAYGYDKTSEIRREEYDRVIERLDHTRPLSETMPAREPGEDGPPPEMDETQPF